MLRWSSTRRQNFCYTKSVRVRYEDSDLLSPNNISNSMLNIYENSALLKENTLSNDQRRHSLFQTSIFFHNGKKRNSTSQSKNGSRLSINLPLSSLKSKNKLLLDSASKLTTCRVINKYPEISIKLTDCSEKKMSSNEKLEIESKPNSYPTALIEKTAILSKPASQQNDNTSLRSLSGTQSMLAVPLGKRRRSSFVREKWANKLEFLLAVIGYAVDLGNIWRFPSVCYKHGGGAFLIPYFVMLCVGGLPMFYLELALGQYHRSGCLSIWKKICPMFKGIGYGICFICTFIACFYNAIIAHSVFFFFSSFAWEVPWTNCNNKWNTQLCRQSVNITSTRSPSGFYIDENKTQFRTPSQEFYLFNVLEIHRSTGLDDLGGIKPLMAFCLFLVFIAVYFALWKGPASTGKAVWITATAPYVVLTILLIRGLTLPGASKGISYYLTPKFDKLLEPAVWTAAATQIFFSLGPGFGVLLALSSYNDFHSNCYRDALVTSIINCFTSFFSGFVIFSTLGYMSELTQRPVSEVIGESESSLIFVVYPQAIATMSYSSIWSIIFFLMLIMLGIDSTFSGLEALITGFCDEYPRILARKRELFVGAVVLFYYIGSLPTVTYGGNYVIPFLDEYGVSLSVLFIVMCEMIAVCWFYGVKRFSNDIRKMLGFVPGLYWRVCWTFCPFFIGLIFALSLYSTNFSPIQLPNYIYPQWSVTLGWILRSLSCLSIPIYIFYIFLKTPGTIRERCKILITPEEYCHSSLHTDYFNANNILVKNEDSNHTNNEQDDSSSIHSYKQSDLHMPSIAHL